MINVPLWVIDGTLYMRRDLAGGFNCVTQCTPRATWPDLNGKLSLTMEKHKALCLGLRGLLERT